MAGYKRVNFYELCRLCATNQQKEKTHIFEEEGRKIQLQNKIQSCLSLKVCENDFLPKVVCSQCLRSLEECFTFRSECVNSESMLSSYFNNFRYTEDFKKSGKVYIKDTPRQGQVQEQIVALPSAPPTPPPTIVDIPTTPTQQKPIQDSLYYVQSGQTTEKIIKAESSAPKVFQNAPVQLNQSYNLMSPVSPQIKCVVKQDQTTVNNITVNSHGEIINLGSISDIEALIAQNMVQKLKHVNVVNNKQIFTPTRRTKVIQDKQDNVVLENGVIRIDLTGSELNQNNYDNQQIKFDKLPHIKTNTEKYMYAIKIDDSAKQNYNQEIVLNQINSVQNQNFHAFSDPIPSSNVVNTTVPNVTYASAAAPPPVTNVTNNINNNISSSMPKVKITSNVKLESQVKLEHTNTINSNIIQTHLNDNFLTEPKSSILVNQQNTVVRSTNNEKVTSQAHAISTVQPSTVNMSNFMSMAYSHHNTVSSSTSSIQSNSTNNNTINAESLVPDPGGSGSGNQSMQQGVPTSSNAIGSSTNSHSASSSSRIHICDICQRVFKRREHLNQHLKLHTGYRPFVCESCNKSFMRKEHLLRHMTSHSGQKNYTCNICEKSFSRNDNLLKHKKTHDKQGKYICEYCSKTFVMKHYYLAHKMTHEPDQKCVWNVVKV